ncbi:Uncharacterised protein [Bordetella pertussis]|nr:Uncharacterised protein [Bordetella pertussis]
MKSPLAANPPPLSVTAPLAAPRFWSRETCTTPPQTSTPLA